VAIPLAFFLRGHSARSHNEAVPAEA